MENFRIVDHLVKFQKEMKNDGQLQVAKRLGEVIGEIREAGFGPDDAVTVEAVGNLFPLMEKNGVTKKQLNNFLTLNYGISSLNALPNKYLKAVSQYIVNKGLPVNNRVVGGALQRQSDVDLLRE